MDNALVRACAHLGVDESQVMSHKVYEDKIALVIDNGIAGCPKHVIPLADLLPAIKAGDSISVDDTRPSVVDYDYESMTVAELQDVARERDISYSGLRKAELIEALEA